MYAFEKWVVDDNSTDVKFHDAKSTTTTFVMPKGEVYISPAKLWITSVFSYKRTYTGEELVHQIGIKALQMSLQKNG